MIPQSVDASHTHEVEVLISKLLDEVQIPFPSLGKAVLAHLADLKRVLSADYREAPGLPPKELLRSLAQVVEREIVPANRLWGLGDNTALLSRLNQTFGPREITVRARPYRRGAGLSLRGFFCRAELGQGRKFVIFLNTAHPPVAVAATFGHELGHYIYDSLVGERGAMRQFFQGNFARHLTDEAEFFADSLVALAAYRRDLIKAIGTAELVPGSSTAFLNRIKAAYELIGARYNLDLKGGGLSVPSRVRYLTSLIHFFKLRRALLEYAGL